MNRQEWERMGLKKTSPLTSTLTLLYASSKLCIVRCWLSSVCTSAHVDFDYYKLFVASNVIFPHVRS